MGVLMFVVDYVTSCQQSHILGHAIQVLIHLGRFMVHSSVVMVHSSVVTVHNNFMVHGS